MTYRDMRVDEIGRIGELDRSEVVGPTSRARVPSLPGDVPLAKRIAVDAGAGASGAA